MLMFFLEIIKNSSGFKYSAVKEEYMVSKKNASYQHKCQYTNPNIDF